MCVCLQKDGEIKKKKTNNEMAKKMVKIGKCLLREPLALAMLLLFSIFHCIKIQVKLFAHFHWL